VKTNAKVFSSGRNQSGKMASATCIHNLTLEIETNLTSLRSLMRDMITIHCEEAVPPMLSVDRMMMRYTKGITATMSMKNRPYLKRQNH
jgi:hypothetical protein